MENPHPTDKQEFELVKSVVKGVWIAVKRNDPQGEKYLARRFHELDAKHADDSDAREKAIIHKNLMYHLDQANVISQILNHENLVSLVGRFHHTPFIGGRAASAEEFLVWDFCDAANLSALFIDQPVEESSYYLPESFCWHVLRSLMRAITYLHDGKRMFYDGETPRYVEVDKDWHPILHRAIESGNVYFQHPRGKETYGLCKLGNFSNAAVTCHVPIDPENPIFQAEPALSITARRGYRPLKRCRLEFDAYKPGRIPLTDRPYELGDELWSIGSILFTMMTGQGLSLQCSDCNCCHIVRCDGHSGSCIEEAAREKGCKCLRNGCKHLSDQPCSHERYDWPRCRCDCMVPDINIDIQLARARYSRKLCEAVKHLLNYYHKQYRDYSLEIPTAVWPVTLHVEELYHDWRHLDKEAQSFVTVEHSATELKQLRKLAKRQQKEDEQPV